MWGAMSWGGFGGMHQPIEWDVPAAAPACSSGAPPDAALASAPAKKLKPIQQKIRLLQQKLEEKQKEVAEAEALNKRLSVRLGVLEAVLPVREQQLAYLQLAESNVAQAQQQQAHAQQLHQQQFSAARHGLHHHFTSNHGTQHIHQRYVQSDGSLTAPLDNNGKVPALQVAHQHTHTGCGSAGALHSPAATGDAKLQVQPRPSGELVQEQPLATDCPTGPHVRPSHTRSCSLTCSMLLADDTASSSPSSTATGGDNNMPPAYPPGPAAESATLSAESRGSPPMQPAATADCNNNNNNNNNNMNNNNNNNANHSNSTTQTGFMNSQNNTLAAAAAAVGALHIPSGPPGALASPTSTGPLPTLPTLGAPGMGQLPQCPVTAAAAASMMHLPPAEANCLSEADDCAMWTARATLSSAAAAASAAACTSQLLATWRTFVREAALYVQYHDARPSDSIPVDRINVATDRFAHELHTLRSQHRNVDTDLLAMNLETEVRGEVPPDELWSSVAKGLRLSGAQVTECRAAHGMYEEQMAAVLAERRALLGRLASCLMSAEVVEGQGYGPASGSVVRAQLGLEAHELAHELVKNVTAQRQAKQLVKDFLASRLTRVQTARAAVLSYPYYPDSVAILHAVVTGGRRGDKGDRGAGGSATATAADANGDMMRDA